MKKNVIKIKFDIGGPRIVGPYSYSRAYMAKIFLFRAYGAYSLLNINVCFRVGFAEAVLGEHTVCEMWNLSHNYDRQTK